MTLELHRNELAESSLEEKRRTEKRFSRGLEDVSHLFLSPSPDKSETKATDITPVQTPSERVQSRIPFLLHESANIDRDIILGFLNRTAAVLEEGLRVIDANMPCDPFGSIDLIALDRQDQLCIINVDVAQNDASFLRGIAFYDWFVRNIPIVRRMYQGRVINFSAQPRVFLVAPEFSPLLQCVAQCHTNPEVCCFAFRTVTMPGDVGILFEQV